MGGHTSLFARYLIGNFKTCFRMQRYLEMTPPLANKIILLINTSPLLKELWEQTIERESGMLNVQEQPKNKQQKAKGKQRSLGLFFSFLARLVKNGG